MRHPSTVFAVVVAVALAAVFAASEWLGEEIEKNRIAYRQQLIESLLVGVAHDEVTALPAAAQAALPSARISGLSAVWQDGRVVALIIDATALRGYGGEIEFLLALRRGKLGALPSLRVLRHRETPGIADFLTTERVSEVFDGVSGATISSTALSQAAAEISDWAADCFDWTSGVVDC